MKDDNKNLLIERPVEKKFMLVPACSNETALRAQQLLQTKLGLQHATGEENCVALLVLRDPIFTKTQ